MCSQIDSFVVAPVLNCSTACLCATSYRPSAVSGYAKCWMSTSLLKCKSAYGSRATTAPSGTGNARCSPSARVVQQAHRLPDTFRHEVSFYDRILVDAPCGSERHHCQQLMKRREQMGREEWSQSRAKRNAILQVCSPRRQHVPYGPSLSIVKSLEV